MSPKESCAPSWPGAWIPLIPRAPSAATGPQEQPSAAAAPGRMFFATMLRLWDATLWRYA